MLPVRFFPGSISYEATTQAKGAFQVRQCEFSPCLSPYTQLKTLVLRTNNLSGGNPDALRDLRDFEELDLSRNDLTGPLSASIGGDKPLRKLWVDRNQLTAGVPEAFGACYAPDNLAIGDTGLGVALPYELAKRIRPEDSEAADQNPLLALIGASERLADMFLEWADTSVAPLLVDLEAMEPRCEADEQ